MARYTMQMFKKIALGVEEARAALQRVEETPEWDEQAHIHMSLAERFEALEKFLTTKSGNYPGVESAHPETPTSVRLTNCGTRMYYKFGGSVPRYVPVELLANKWKQANAQVLDSFFRQFTTLRHIRTELAFCWLEANQIEGDNVPEVDFHITGNTFALRMADAVRFGSIVTAAQAAYFKANRVPITAVPALDSDVFTRCAKLCVTTLSELQNGSTEPKVLSQYNRIHCASMAVMNAEVRRVSEHFPVGVVDAVRAWLHEMYVELKKFRHLLAAVPEPVMLELKGAPGVGKSTLAQRLASIYGYGPEDFYSRGRGKHWDGYTGQPVVIYDDLFQGDKKTVSASLAEIGQIRNKKAQYVLPMAELAQKGTIFCSPLVIITCNEYNIEKYDITPGMYQRRVDSRIEILGRHTAKVDGVTVGLAKMVGSLMDATNGCSNYEGKPTADTDRVEDMVQPVGDAIPKWCEVVEGFEAVCTNYYSTWEPVSPTPCTEVSDLSPADSAEAAVPAVTAMDELVELRNSTDDLNAKVRALGAYNLVARVALEQRETEELMWKHFKYLVLFDAGKMSGRGQLKLSSDDIKVLESGVYDHRYTMGYGSRFYVKLPPIVYPCGLDSDVLAKAACRIQEPADFLLGK